MEMKEERKGQILILKLDGELLGGEDTRRLQERIYQAIQEGDVNMVADMSRVKWMNSSGLGVVMAGLTTLRGSGGDLRLAGLSERLRRPIQITKLDTVIMMYESVKEAIQSYTVGG